MSFKRAPPCCGSDERSFRLPISWGFFNHYLSFAFCCLLLQGFPKPSCFFGNIWYSVERNMLNASNHQVQNIFRKGSWELTNPLEKSFSKVNLLERKPVRFSASRSLFRRYPDFEPLFHQYYAVYMHIYIQSIFLKNSVGPVWTSNLIELHMKCPLKRSAMRVPPQSTLSFESP